MVASLESVQEKEKRHPRTQKIRTTLLVQSQRCLAKDSYQSPRLIALLLQSMTLCL